MNHTQQILGGIIMGYTNKQLEKMVVSTNSSLRLAVAREGKYLDVLYKDSDVEVREEVASQGAYLKELSKDSEYTVRCQVLRQGYNPEMFVDDPSWVVRAELAEQGGFNYILCKDEDSDVRRNVALRGEYHEELANDVDEEVRMVLEYLEGATTKVIATYFGTYEGLLLLHMWKDKYTIRSGCYKTNNLKEWVETAELQLNADKAKEMGAIIAQELQAYYGV